MAKTPRLTLSFDQQPDDGVQVLGTLEETAEHRTSAFDLVAKTPWAITPDMLETISAIARRENEPVEALQAKLGRPLQNTRNVSIRGNSAIIPVTGPIFRFANMFTEISGATSLDMLAKEFTAAVEDPNVSSIILEINSPGGQASGISDFAQLVRASNKPVYAFVEQAASAAYWIGSAAKEVVISRNGIAGNVGAVLGLDASKNPNRVEIVSSQSPNKRPDVATDQGRAQLQAMVDAQAQVFIEDVASNRGMTAEAVIADWNGGDVFTGAKAVEVKMADRVGTLEMLIAELAGNNLKPATSFSMKGTAMTLEDLRAAHPDLCAALVEEGRAAGFEAGANAERQRIQDVEANALPGHEALIQTLKFDGKTTGPEAAVQVLQAVRASNAQVAETIKSERPAPVPAAAAPADEPAVDASAPVEDQAQAEWDKNATIRAEFGEFGTYLAFRKNQGRVKTVGKKG